MAKKILLLVGLGVVISVGGFLLIQLIPYGRNHANPPVVREPNWDSPQTRELAQRACFDCHSNQSAWPWYSNIAPISWLIQRDVDAGRRKLNFSDWKGGTRENESARELTESIREGKMPTRIYLVLHPQAALTSAEKQQLITGLTATVGRR